MAHITLKHLRDQIKTSIFIPSPELDLKLLLGSSGLEAENQGQEMKVHDADTGKPLLALSPGVLLSSASPLLSTGDACKAHGI